ncbi:thiamine pyrophosphate-dependent dehydrogenase E1 component subunit alpha [Xenorhabdus bovienii]|uniref:thiamine pyrophosphate-dependent dehydrogenase E1 component subunit alpha n=1 Tax=Xenorhabdus bovienii TaxID=40576 RepID=UPI00237CE790|nr:thiamine pyrophosphate-dependent dehydrogenase E1 component subunit alpha [Xenorhabdus bovienii]MDE1482047.1 thiamine pyrophosphate-dependent dehydrogenase E1 component subunit alpha [Xenorhabdus bovienii]MDE9441120.1 thiamine pyrophosphate-dependent dehydrogenase E1 component subunit alpha [Xenorhabdus bovienii]MDE9546570.1 thiamine pyrophosphate-dependent dehydrogenase E1 component subunit alpha [Xenorhabdus bovienii]
MIKKYPSISLELYKKSYLVRAADEKINEGLLSHDFFALHYPVKGQEIISASISINLTEGDKIISNYRCLGDLIAAGVNPYTYFSEIMGKRDGLSGGKGGCMHLCSPENGFLATTGIVGGGLPIANGVALALKLSDTNNIVFVTFGDGATTTGAYHEAMNIASLWKLPVLFICINNMYALHTRLSRIATNTSLYQKALSYDLPAERVDVCDPVNVLQKITAFAQKVRTQNGPLFIEIYAPRLHGHMAGSSTDYMNMPSEEKIKEIDSLLILRKELVSHILSERELKSIEEGIDAFVNTSYQDAINCPLPDSETLLTQITEV